MNSRAHRSSEFFVCALMCVCNVCAQVLQLLSARQLGPAAAVAAACGDVALSTLLAGAPTHAACQAEVAQQLRVWQASGTLGHIARGRLLVYQLLAGQVRVWVGS